MTTFKCKLCSYIGTRRTVRLHLRKEHHIRGKQKDVNNKVLDSDLSAMTVRL